MNSFLILLTILSFLSISAFEGAIILGLIYIAIVCFRKRKGLRGELSLPLLVHAVPTLLSTLMYAPHLLNKAFERSVFLFLYFGGDEVKVNENYLYRLNLILNIIGLFLLPVVFYKYHYKGTVAPIWGGVFEVATFYSLFSLSALALYLKTKRVWWLFAFFVFISIVFFTLRRSTVLGLIATLILLIFLLRSVIKLRYMILIALLSLSFGAIFSYNFVKKDERFQVFYKVLTGQERLEDKTLDAISSLRWANLRSGLMVIERDVKEANIIPLLIGHGLKPEEREGLYIKSAVGYESVLFVSEFIEKGLLGLFAILWLYWKYYSFLFRYRLTDFLVIPFLLMPSVMFVGSLFTGFWDALLPLYFLWFRMVEQYERP
ncbi:MAG: hypothetical protein ACK4FY_05230 [Aquificaceae bacterium]